MEKGKFFSFAFLDSLDFHSREVLKGASVAFVLKLLAAALTFLFHVAVARFLGAHGAGLFLLSLSIATFGSVLGRMGLDNVLLRHVASGAASGDWNGVKGVYRNGVKLALLASSLVSIGIFCSAGPISRLVFDKPELTVVLRLMALSIPGLALSLLYAQMLKGLQRIPEAMLLQGVWVPAFSLLLLFFMVSPWGVNGAAGAYALAGVVSLGAGVFSWHRTAPGLRSASADFEFRRLVRSGLPLLSTAMMQLLIKWFPMFLLGIWAEASDVAVFGAAFRTAVTLNFLLIAVSSVVSPKFAVFYLKKDLAGLERMAKNSTRFLSLLMAPILMVFLIFPSPIMSVFGPQFTRGSAVLSILAVAQFINVGTGSVQAMLVMSGHERLMNNIAIIFATVSFGLNVALIPMYGILGAALATAAVIGGENILLSVLVQRRLGINLLPF